MRLFVESLKRLYSNGSVNKTIIDGLLTASKIDQSEYDYIVGG